MMRWLWKKTGIKTAVAVTLTVLATLPAVASAEMTSGETVSAEAASAEAVFAEAVSVEADSAETDSSEAFIELYARSAVLMDGGSGRILYNKEGDVPLPMASTTKIMTCILALEWLGDNAGAICTVSGTASAQPEVKLGMVKGDTFFLSDLLYSLMLESHNDTAVCIAETIGGSVEQFAALMNEKASEIGCTQTYYITPNGLDAEDENGEHHTTAHDLALVMRYCLTESSKSAEFLAVTQTASYTFTNTSGTRTYSCSNHNAFLNLMEGALSGKTGFTAKAGYCYVGALERDGKLLIVALLACGWPNNKGYKWVDTKKLMNYGLSEFESCNITALDIALPSAEILVVNGQQESVSITLAEPAPANVLMCSDDSVEIRTELLQAIEAPVAADTQVGLVHYLVDGKEYAVASVLTVDSVEKRTYWYCLEKLMKEFLL